MDENYSTKTVEEYELIFNAKHDVLMTVRLNDGIIIDANNEFTTLLGYTHGEIIGKSYKDINLYINSASHNWQKSTGNESNSDSFEELIFIKKDGSFFKKLMSSQIVMLSADETSETDTSQSGMKEEKVEMANGLKEKVQELVFQTREKENRAAELAIANRELTFQNEEKDKRAAELAIANEELLFQSREKADRAAELVIANRELVFQNEEKDKRAAELAIANKELLFQIREKANRAAELAVANHELVFQNSEKDKRATELVMANKELAFQNEEIMYLIFHDKLTGLANREFYMEELKRLDTADNLPLTVIVGDVNGLTQINDSFGETAGDELLKKFAGIIKKSCRPKDIISRISGDEFVILLPKTDAYQAEDIIKQMNVLSLREKVGSMNVSISFGSETKQSEEDEIQVVLKQAGKYMYEQKNAK